MVRWIGYKEGRVKTVSTHLFESQELTILEVPVNFDNVSNDELLLAKVKNNQIFLSNTKYDIKKLKLAIITNLYMQCGISTYAESLFEPLLKEVNDYKIFVEYNDLPTDVKQKWPVVKCWKRGQSTVELVNKIKEYDPDMVFINHEWGLFPNARHWLSLLTQLSDYRIITTLHSVFPFHFDKTISEAAIPEIIVHSNGAKQALENKGSHSKIYVIPHGCYPLSSKDKLWNIYQSSHTFLEQGFGFSYKRFDIPIKATHILKEKYPDIFFTALISESPFNKVAHQNYYDSLKKLINELGLQNNVAIVRGYQSDDVVDAYYRTNSVAVFPYESEPEHLVYGASGSARLAMSKKLPVITSHHPHFLDLPTIKADTPEQIAKALDQLFSNQDKQKEQIERQNRYIEDNSWEKIAAQYIKIFEGT